MRLRACGRARSCYASRVTKCRGIKALTAVAWLTAAALLGVPASAFAQSPPDTAPSHVVTQPDWLRRPAAEDMARFYPPTAARQDGEGRAVVACQAAAEGTQSPCGAGRPKTRRATALAPRRCSSRTCS